MQYCPANAASTETDRENKKGTLWVLQDATADTCVYNSNVTVGLKSKGIGCYCRPISVLQDVTADICL